MRRTDLEKWEGLTQKMGRSDSKQGRSDSKTGRSDSKKAPCSHHKKNNKSQKPFPFSQVHFYHKNLLLYNRIPPTTLSVSVLLYFFLIRVFFYRHWRFTGQQGKGGPIFLSTTSTRSKTFRHLFATLLGRWPSRIFNCNASIYQTATQ